MVSQQDFGALEASLLNLMEQGEKEKANDVLESYWDSLTTNQQEILNRAILKNWA